MSDDRLQLQRYLTLERIMLELDEAQDARADKVRDLMDSIFFELSDAEREWLDGRGVIGGVATVAPIRLSLRMALAETAPHGPTHRTEPVHCRDWRLAA
jgi:hypothetical protein